jgi:hypothetical protein
MVVTGMLVKQGNQTSAFIKVGGISWLDEQVLASQKGLYSMQLIRQVTVIYNKYVLRQFKQIQSFYRSESVNRFTCSILGRFFKFLSCHVFVVVQYLQFSAF